MSADHNRTRRLFARLRESDDRDAREALVLSHQPLVEYLAKRFSGRGESLDDLHQTANLALVKAIERFDPDYGTRFTTYATATIVGELKRYLRDHAWDMRIPRDLKEHAIRVSAAQQEVGQRLGRSPTVADLAEATGLSVESVLEALDAGRAYSLPSLDAPAANGSTSAFDLIGSEDEMLRLAERLATIAPAVGDLPEREQRILFLRFYRDMTQSQIAKELGISQMHVSRLLAQALDKIRRWAPTA